MGMAQLFARLGALDRVWILLKTTSANLLPRIAVQPTSDRSAHESPALTQNTWSFCCYRNDAMPGYPHGPDCRYAQSEGKCPSTLPTETLLPHLDHRIHPCLQRSAFQIQKEYPVNAHFRVVLPWLATDDQTGTSRYQACADDGDLPFGLPEYEMCCLSLSLIHI